MPYSEAEVGKAIKNLGLLFVEGEESTDPKIMASLIDDCGMDGFEHPAIDLLRTKAISYGPLKQKIIAGIAANPAMAEAILNASAAGVGTLSADNKKQLIEGMHFTVLLEVLTTLMVNDQHVANKLQDSILKQRGIEDVGSSSSTFKAIRAQTDDSFTAVKMVSVDPGMWRFRCWRQHSGPNEPTQKQVEDFITKHGLSGVNASFLLDAQRQEQAKTVDKHTGLRTNIAEALISQAHVNVAGCDQNIRAGVALIAYVEDPSIVLPTKYQAGYAIPLTVGPDAAEDLDVPDGPEDPVALDMFPEVVDFNDPETFWNMLYRQKAESNTIPTIQGMPEEWTHLYESWNAQFVLTKFPEVSHLILPKLLIPATLSADPEQYMATRVFSLWLTLNFMAKLVVKRADSLEISHPENRDKFLQIWAQANSDYADKSLMPLINRSREDLNKLHEETFKPMIGGNGVSLANQFVTYALAIKSGRNISQESPSFAQRYGGRSAFLLIAGIVLICVGAITFGATSIVGIGLIAGGAALAVAPAAAKGIDLLRNQGILPPKRIAADDNDDDNEDSEENRLTQDSHDVGATVSDALSVGPVSEGMFCSSQVMAVGLYRPPPQPPSRDDNIHQIMDAHLNLGADLPDVRRAPDQAVDGAAFNLVASLPVAEQRQPAHAIDDASLNLVVSTPATDQQNVIIERSDELGQPQPVMDATVSLSAAEMRARLKSQQPVSVVGGERQPDPEELRQVGPG